MSANYSKNRGTVELTLNEVGDIAHAHEHAKFQDDCTICVLLSHIQAKNWEERQRLRELQFLHANEDGYCGSCGSGPFDFVPAEWPCRTFEALEATWSK